jgi:hypothetical protein
MEGYSNFCFEEFLLLFRQCHISSTISKLNNNVKQQDDDCKMSFHTASCVSASVLEEQIITVSNTTVCEMRLLLKVNGHKLLIESRGKSFLIFSCAHPLLYGVEMMKSSSQLVLRLWSCLYSTGLLALVQASNTPS